MPIHIYHDFTNRIPWLEPPTIRLSMVCDVCRLIIPQAQYDQAPPLTLTTRPGQRAVVVHNACSRVYEQEVKKTCAWAPLFAIRAVSRPPR